MNNLEHSKIVDIIDEGIMLLACYRKTGTIVSKSIIDELIDIINFISEAKTNDYAALLHDKRITIDYASLNYIHKNFEFQEAQEYNLDIELKITKERLRKLNQTKLSDEEINHLENTLLAISVPFWNYILKNKYE